VSGSESSSPDGKTLATGGSDGARLWNVTAATFRQLGSPPAEVTGQITWMVFSPDGTALVTSSQSGTAQVWDVPTGQQVGKPVTPDGGGETVTDRNLNLRATAATAATAASAASVSGTHTLVDLASSRNFSRGPASGPRHGTAAGGSAA
jgi:WD40 repeat protein